MAKTVKMAEVALKQLEPYERNAKIHTQEQVKKIAQSIKEFGFVSPCLIDSEYHILAGHGRVLAAQEIGMEKVPCVFVEGLTEEQRKAYILADNRLTEMGEWDKELVSEELKDLREGGFDFELTGFDIDDIVIDDIEDIDVIEPCGIQEDRPSRVKKGEIWILGRHRLMCGDSTNPEDLETLMGGVEADLLETDPPYNVAVEGMAGKIENDDMPDADFYEFLKVAFCNAANVMRPGASFYIWHADSNGLQFRAAAEEAGLSIHQVLIWVKSHFTVGRQDYQWQHEPCLFGWIQGAAHYFIDARSLSSVQDFTKEIERMSRDEMLEVLKSYYEEISTVTHEKKPNKSELHPTMKPLSIIKKHIRNSSKEGDSVLDIFGGSGTTLVACEEMGRRCFMMEYDPHFCDVIIGRWESMTGEKGVLLDEQPSES